MRYLVPGHWLLASGRWLLASGRRLLVSGRCPLVAGHDSAAFDKLRPGPRQGEFVAGSSLAAGQQRKAV